jgi:hypothetical protein
MENAVLVFKEAQDGEEAGAAERAHPQVLRLEREGEAHARVAEVLGQVLVHRAVRPHQLQRAQHVEAEHVRGRGEGALQHRPEGLQLAPVLRQEGPQPARVARRQARDLGLHAVHVGRRVDALAALEHQAVLRVELPQLHFLLQRRATGREDLGQDARIQEKGGAEVEAVAAGRGERARAAADDAVALVQRHARAGGGEHHG